jgi:hypothetical protein
MLHSREGRARLARVVGVELAGSVGWLGLPRFRWGSRDMFAILEEHVERERSVFVARMEVRLGANLVGAFEVARSEHRIAFVSFATESRSWLVAHLEVLDGGHAFPLTLVLNDAGRIVCAFHGVVRGQAHFRDDTHHDAFAAIFQMPAAAPRYSQMVPVHVDLTSGAIRAAFDLDVIAAPLGASAATPWILLGGGARLHALAGHAAIARAHRPRLHHLRPPHRDITGPHARPWCGLRAGGHRPRAASQLRERRIVGPGQRCAMGLRLSVAAA